MLYRLSRQYSGIHVYIHIHMYTQQQWKRSSRVWKKAKEYMGGLAGKKRENDIISKINKNKKKKACHRPSVWVLTELRFQKGPFLQRLWDGKRRPQLTNRTGNVPCQRHHQSAQRNWASLTDKSLASDCGSSCKVKGYQSTQSLPSLPLIFSWKPDLKKEKFYKRKSICGIRT